MKTIELEVALANFLDFRQSDIIFNITVISQLLDFETDVLQITKSGYLNAFELKVSKADLKKDLKKNYIKGKVKGFDYFRKLKTFSYVVPEELKEDALNQIPDFAGLYKAIEIQSTPKRISIRCIKPPKVLGKREPITDSQKLAFLRLGNMRVITLKKRLISHEDN